MDRLIVMDNVSGVADISKKIANFLTVSRKFGYHCVCVSGNITYSNLAKNNFTNSFNIFPASVPHNTVSKILQSNCIMKQKNMFWYIPSG